MSKLLIFFMLFLLSSFNVKADVIPPEYFEKKCAINETEVQCTYRSEKPFGPRTYDGCSNYANNSNYRYLTGSGSSFGGTEKYCTGLGPYSTITPSVILTFTPTPTNIISPTIPQEEQIDDSTITPKSINSLPFTNPLIYLLVTILFEIPVFFIFGYKKKKEIVVILLANISSVLAFLLSGFYFTYNVPQIIIAEIAIIIFEFLIIAYLTENSYRKTLLLTILVNLFSALFGTALLVWISYY